MLQHAVTSLYFTQNEGALNEPFVRTDMILYIVRTNICCLVDKQMILSLCDVELTQEVWGRG